MTRCETRGVLRRAAALAMAGLLLSCAARTSQSAAATPEPATGGLSIARIACTANQATLECLSETPDARHEVLCSTDLRRWELAPAAVWEKVSSQRVRATLPHGNESSLFYRVLDLGASPAPVLVNLQLDAELEDTQGIRNLTTELMNRGISSTVYVTAEYANRNAMLIGEFFRAGFEIALHGYYTGEQLETMTYAEQKDLLTRAKKAVEGCKPCGTYRPVVGFRPQYFSQNGDTFRVLDELGMTHNSGFKVGQIYLPGHAEDAWPYRAETNLFSVIPITTVAAGNDRVYLCDIACAQSLNWTSAQWEQALMSALTSAIETRRPLVMLLHGWYTGDRVKYNYWEPFIKFLDTARERVTFVNSTELVSLAPR